MRSRPRWIWATAALTTIAGVGIASCGDRDSVAPEPRAETEPPTFHVGDVKPIRMTGGGRIDYPPGTAEKNTPESRTFQTFALTVGDKDGDGLPEGKLRFVDHTPAHRLNGRPVNLRSVSWRTYVRTVDACRDAGIEATGTLEVKNTGERHEFRLWACDHGEPGTKDPHDLFSLDVFYPDGIKRWGWGGKLTGGNLQAHFEKTTTTPTTGDLEVKTSTTGSSLDPDGYTVVLDGTTSRAIGVNERVVFTDLSAADHTVELTGVASNCTVGGSNPRTVSVTAGMVTSTTFSVSCEAVATTGDLDVTAATTGDDLDPDGYTVTVDGTTSQAIGVNATVRFADLAEGSHTVELSGVASNCTVSGDNPRSVTITAGSVTSTTFSVSCEATTTTGARITGLGAIGTSGTATPGTDWQTFDFEATDAPGGRVAYTDYAVVRADGTPGSLTVDPSADPSTAITSFTQTSAACVTFGGTGRLDTGELVDFTIDGCDNGSPGAGVDAFGISIASLGYSKSGTLAEGEITLDTGDGTAPTTGDLDVISSTTGSDLDADGYTVTVDGTTSAALGVNDTIRFTGLAEGSHTVELSGVASNCTVSGDNPRSVTITAGAVTSTTFSVSCEATSGGTVTTRITGLGAIGTSGTPTPGTDWRTFDFDATDAPDGRLAYTDYAVVRADGSVATVTVDPSADPSTAITSFTRSSTDPACATFGGTGRVDTGELVDFAVTACDHGSPGAGVDYFEISIPERGGYLRGDLLAEGEITLSTSTS